MGAERAPGQDREMQYWALEAPAGETASIRLESDDFDARLYLLGFGLRESIRDRDDVAGMNAELTVTFPETGTYYVAVEAYGSSPTGSYSVTVTGLRLGPAQSHYYLGNTLRRRRETGDLDRAVEEYREALRLDPDHLGAHINLGNALRVKGDLDGAVEQYREALRVAPDDETARQNLETVLRERAPRPRFLER